MDRKSMNCVSERYSDIPMTDDLTNFRNFNRWLRSVKQAMFFFEGGRKPLCGRDDDALRTTVGDGFKCGWGRYMNVQMG